MAQQTVLQLSGESLALALATVIFGFIVSACAVAWWTYHICNKATGLDIIEAVNSKYSDLLALQTKFLEDISVYNSRQHDPTALATWLAKSSMVLSGQDAGLLPEMPDSRARQPHPKRFDDVEGRQTPSDRV